MALSICVSIGLARSADASLIGQTITCSMTGDIPCDVPSTTVGGGGALFSLDPAGGQLDFFIYIETTFVNITSGGNQVVVTFDPGPYILTIGDLIWPDDPSAILVGISDFSPGASLLEESDIVVGPHTLTIDLTNTYWDSQMSADFDLVWGQRVPEPEALGLLGLLGLGLAGLGLSRRRKFARG